jgi:hypothetical protein
MRVRSGEVDIGLRLLDHQLVDAVERRCGKVDDIEFAIDDQGLYVAALLTGPRAQARRCGPWLRRVIGWIGRDVEHRVPWPEVRVVDVTIELLKGAEDLGLADGEERLSPLIKRLPRG